jgi:hypothetical protein
MSTPAQRLQSERFRYPGLLPREIIVMREWLKQHQAEYARFLFNLRLGTGYDPGPTFTDAVRRSAVLNSMKRLDALAINGSAEYLAAFDAWAAKPVSSLPVTIENTADTLTIEDIHISPVPSGYASALLIEAKDRAAFPSIGQLVGYRALWRAAQPTDVDPGLLMVTNRIVPDLLPVSQEVGIRIDVVEANYDELRNR